VGEVKAMYCEYPGVPDSMDRLPDFAVLRLAAGSGFNKSYILAWRK